MIELKREIEDFLNSNWSNTNDKEQNMQGRLYAWLLRYEKLGYIIEMETSIIDEHLQEVMPQNLAASKPCKKEMDILIYKNDMTELYAVELKWIYNRDKGWNVADHLEDYKKDVKFCKWLVEKADFTETCSVVVYDFEEEKQVKRPRHNGDKEKILFWGDKYPVDKSKVAYIRTDADCCTPFMWHKLENRPTPNRDYYYYIIPFQNIHVVSTKVAIAVERIYGFDWVKCVSMVMQSSWWESQKNTNAIQHANIPEITASICREIDNNTII